MTTMRVFLLLGLLVFASACNGVPRSEFDEHVARYEALQSDYDTLKGELQGWASSMKDWGERTRATVCDIVAKNGPPTKYEPSTELYCSGSEGNGAPPDPPEFGG